MTLVVYGHLKKLDKIKRTQNKQKEEIDKSRTYQEQKVDQSKMNRTPCWFDKES